MLLSRVWNMNNEPEVGVAADVRHAHIGNSAMQLSERVTEDGRPDQEEQ
jgi:hypothetical protein